MREAHATPFERVDFDGGVDGRREAVLGTLAGDTETTDSVRVSGEILVLAMELLDEQGRCQSPHHPSEFHQRWL